MRRRRLVRRCATSLIVLLTLLATSHSVEAGCANYNGNTAPYPNVLLALDSSTHSWRQALDVRVRVRVPRGTSLDLGTVNHGDVEVAGISGDLELSNTNGSITATAVSGSVVAETVNGGITIEFLRVTPDKPMAFATLNGTVDVTLPPDTAAALVLDAGNASIMSDFKIALERTPPKVEKGREGGRYRVEVENEVRGTINGDGAEMRFETFNGSIVIRKGG